MKKRYLLIIIIMSISKIAFSQSILRTFKGRVVDSAGMHPLADASICIYRASDTSLLNFGFTTPNGNFSMTTKSTDSLLIIVSLFGYSEHINRQPASEQWSFSSFPDIKLAKLPNSFGTIRVRSSAITMKGDTIEINASRFKVLPGSDVAQLFKKIPGFEVSVKGEIKVNGSPVTKIMVDGSDFFGNNPGLVSKNLSADMIETVQVFEDHNEDGSPKEQASKVINLKLKKGKKNGTFGDLMAGYGTRERYEAGARLNNFKNDRKFSVILNANNINETGFDFGFQNGHNAYGAERNGNSGSDDFWKSSSYNDNGSGNINNKMSGGLTYFNEFSRKRKLSFSAFGSRNNYFSTEASKSINAINDSTQRSNTDSSSTRGTSYSGTFETNYSKVGDSTGRYDIGISTSWDDNRANTGTVNAIRLNDLLLNQGNSSVKNNSLSRSVNLKGNVWRALRKDKRYTFSGNFNYEISNQQNQSFQFLQNNLDTFNNLNERLTKSKELLVKVFGKMPVYKKLMLNLSADRWADNNYSEQLSKSAQNPLSGQFEQSYNNKIDTLSVALNNKMEQYTIKPFLSISDKKFYVSGGVTLMQFRMDNQLKDSAQPIVRTYRKALPFAIMNYYSSKFYLYFSASKATSFPTITELLPTLNISNNYERRSGNKNLAPEDNYNFRLYSSFYKIKGFKYLYMSSNGSMSDNAKIWASRQTADGIIVKTPENARGKKTLNGGISAGKKITKVLTGTMGLSNDWSRNPLIINQNASFGTNNHLSLTPGINFTKSDSLDLNLSMTINQNNYKNGLNEMLNFNQVTFSYSMNIRTLLKTGTEISSTLDISDQRNVPGIGKVIPVWNAYLQHPLGKKGAYNLKLTAYDILKRNTNITRYSSENYIYISQNNQLQQYFMLSLIYKIKKMGGDDEFNYTY
jgi:hypothetical protein